jgi:hypothetical protein
LLKVGDSFDRARNDLNFPTREVAQPIEPRCDERRKARQIRLRSDPRTRWPCPLPTRRLNAAAHNLVKPSALHSSEPTPLWTKNSPSGSYFLFISASRG